MSWRPCAVHVRSGREFPTQDDQTLNAQLDALELLLPDFQYVDTDHDRIVVTVGLKATFYFWNGHQRDIRRSIVDCAEAYQKKYGVNLTWGFHPELSKLFAVSSGKLPQLRKYVDTLDEDDAIEWFMSSGADSETAGEYKLEILTERGWHEGRMSVFSFTLPRNHAFDAEEKKFFFELFSFCVDRLSPFHGHAGLAAISSYEAENWQTDELDLATRYYGLYNEATYTDSNKAPNGLKSVDWITVIGQTLAERGGGTNALADAMTNAGITMQKMSTTLMIFTGDTPDIAPVGREISANLLAINGLLRPLRNGWFGSMAFGSADGSPRFDRCTSDLWIRRLDRPGVWPPATFIGLGKEPLGSVPSKNVVVRTGESVPVYGRYQRRDAEKPELVLMPGDIAPYRLKLGPHGEYLGREAETWKLVAAL